MSEDPTDDARVGLTLQGRYRVLERLAAGGMGVVYRGERVGLQRPVAIKFLHHWVAADQRFLKRFEVEARAMSRLAHPHCVSVIDFGVEDGAPYLVMDFVTGQTLRELLQKGPMEPDRAVMLMKQVLAGLAHAHQAGIVHRDIKPENITITDVVGAGEQVRILDFGLAKLADINTSVAGVVVGTPSYMSPEQSLGRTIDSRTDLYSTAILLFELLTGKKPFRGDQPIDVLRQHQTAPPPHLPVHLERPELEAVLHRALAKEPRDRYQTAAEMAEALQASVEIDGKGLSGATIPSMPTVEMSSASIEIIHGSGALPVVPRPLKAAAGATSPASSSGELSSPSGVSLSSQIGSAPARNRGPWLAIAVGAVALVAGGYWWSQRAPQPEPLPPSSSPRAARPPTRPSMPVPPPPEVAPIPPTRAPEVTPPPPPVAPEPAPPVAPEPVPSPPPVAVPAPVPPHPAGPRDAADIPGLAELERKLDSPRQRTAAIKGLIHLRGQYPTNAHLALILGNAYMENLWWSDGLVAYGDAIRLDPTYRLNPTLLRNSCRALMSDKLATRVNAFFERTLGAAALPYLEDTARNTKVAKVHQRATRLIARISPKR